jgi:DNA-directed RNA polymerase subunit M/transcription elongation factor TFIIS
MDFCPNCNNIFDITKSATQTGGANDNEEKIIESILNNEPVDIKILDALDMDNLVKSNSYKKLKQKHKEFVFNKLQDLMPVEKKKIVKEYLNKPQGDKAFFICKNCGYLKQIEENTLIFSKVSNDVAESYTTSDFTEMSYSDILPRTRKYICPNPKCISAQDYSKREAVFFRLNNTFKVKYICLACQTTF